jgi:acetoin utilization deacetylase AcuC-like enzyme
MGLLVDRMGLNHYYLSVTQELDPACWSEAHIVIHVACAPAAGYDAHYLDPLAGLQYEGRTYHLLCTTISHLAQELCGGRAVLVLEGGYHVPSLVSSVIDSFAGLTGQSCSGDGQRAVGLQEEPLDKVGRLITELQKLHGL